MLGRIPQQECDSKEQHHDAGAHQGVAAGKETAHPDEQGNLRRGRRRGVEEAPLAGALSYGSKERVAGRAATAGAAIAEAAGRNRIFDPDLRRCCVCRFVGFTDGRWKRRLAARRGAHRGWGGIRGPAGEFAFEFGQLESQPLEFTPSETHRGPDHQTPKYAA